MSSHPSHAATTSSQPQTLRTVPSAGQLLWAGQTKAAVRWEIHRGDLRAVVASFEADRFDCVVTSPPYYWQRDYDVEGQIGQEKSIEGYVGAICECFDAIKRVLKPTGLVFLNLGDTYYSAKGQPKGDDKKNKARRFGLRAVDASGLGVPRKTTIGIPWRVALEMVSRGWVLRSPIIWQRKGTIPEPTAKDRPWRTYEFIFMFSKSPKYYFNRAALGGEEDIWLISSRAKSGNGVHYAAFPEQLVERCLDVGCPKGGSVFDPFMGSGTTLKVALARELPSVGVDIKAEFCQLSADNLVKL